jgi:glutathione synthase/RimK-type ligase-like ATP-grasp enzyme
LLRFENLTSIWFRRPNPVSAHASIVDEEVRGVVEQDCREFVDSIWDGMICPMLPGTPSAMRVAQRKAAHMARAQALGFEIAPTLFTNDPQEFLDLYRSQSGQLINKITSTLALRARMGTEFLRLTNAVTHRDVAHAESVSLSPIIFQAYVPKRVEVRVIVVGSRVFAAEIHSQASNRSRFDWRRYDLAATPHYPHELPDDIAERCVKLVAQSHLSYGAIDLILTPDGRYVFLELNSAGEYGWIEQTTGLPISAAIADFLIAEPAHA